MIKQSSRISFFTLLETVMAMAILALAMVGTMGITINAAKRMGKAQTKWEEQHMLNQALEYYLLAGPKESIPDEFFPYEDYKAQCIIEDPELPEEVENEVGKWRLVTLKISVLKDDTPVASISLDQILQKDDVE